MLNIYAIRRRVGMTQAQFAAAYDLNLDTLQGWECGRRKLDRAAQTLLRAIARDPESAARLFAPEPTTA
jgi:putative transcriptional regulator